jgi:hypothetical protein
VKGPYKVIRMGTGYDVVDVRWEDDSKGGYRRVSHHKSNHSAWKKADKLNREFVAKHHDNLYEE